MRRCRGRILIDDAIDARLEYIAALQTFVLDFTDMECDDLTNAKFKRRLNRAKRSYKRNFTPARLMP